MVTPKCPKCRRAIPGDDVNVANDIAFCRACGVAHSFARLIADAELENGVDLNRPPAGAWHRVEGLGTVIGATHRSWGGALGALAAALFCNGILSVFVLLALSSTLHLLGVTLPDYFPAPRMNDSDMGVGMTLFLWLFLTPFIVIGLGLIGAFLAALIGRTEVRLGQGQGTVYTGLGPLGYRRRFDPADIKEVRLDEQLVQNDHGTQRKTQIVLESHSGKLIKFGTLLREDRRRFVAAAVRKEMAR